MPRGVCLVPTRDATSRRFVEDVVSRPLATLLALPSVSGPSCLPPLTWPIVRPRVYTFHTLATKSGFQHADLHCDALAQSSACLSLLELVGADRALAIGPFFAPPRVVPGDAEAGPPGEALNTASLLARKV